MMSNMLLKRYSVRPVGIMATLLFSILNVILSCVRNIYEMAFLFFLQGFGAGLIITICNTVFNSYFVKRRAKVRQSQLYSSDSFYLLLRISRTSETGILSRLHYLLSSGNVRVASHYRVGRHHLSHIDREDDGVVRFSR